VAFIFKTLAVSEFSGIDTATEIVVLRCRGWRPRAQLVTFWY
jgi:hypothetical protein